MEKHVVLIIQLVYQSINQSVSQGDKTKKATVFIIKNCGDEKWLCHVPTVRDS